MFCRMRECVLDVLTTVSLTCSVLVKVHSSRNNSDLQHDIVQVSVVVAG